MTVPGPHGSPAGSAGARGRILERIGRALDGREPVAHPGPLLPAPHPGGGPTTEERATVLARAVARSGGEVVLLSGAAEARAWLRTFAGGFASAAIEAEVPAGLRPELPEAEPAAADLGVSLALASAADTGTLLLSSRHGRACQLLPPTHLVWVEAASVHADLAAALTHLRARGALPAAVGLHSGPSKSADIGQILVTGVHGPGRLVVAVGTFPFDATEPGREVS